METRAGGFEQRGLGRRGLLLVLLAVVAIRLPFLNQAIQGDDVYYLAAAEHAQIDPLHPNHVKYVFLGDEVDFRGHPHPPLDAWFLGTLLALLGDIHEAPFHAAYIVFSVIAALSMWSLARRFSLQPLWASLLFLAVPAFVVNGNSLEADLPFVAFWMAAVALFCSRRLWLASLAMALASLAAYQAILLIPILWVYCRLYRRRDKTAWAVTLVPAVTIVAYQLFERFSSGALPAAVLNGYFEKYGFQALAMKLRSAAALSVHAWFLVFPALVPPAMLLSWRKRREPDTIFLTAWIGIFFAGALAIFFAGSARYLLPMAAPVALLVSRLRPKWLAVGFAAQMTLAVLLAIVNYQHWAGYREFAGTVPAARRVWIDGEWGLRYYLEAAGGLALQHGQMLYPGDIVVTSELAYPVQFTAPVAPLAQKEISSPIPLRLIGLESHSGYSTASRGFWPFGLSAGPIDRVRAEMVVERRPTLEFLPVNAREAADQIVTGFYSLEGNWRWMGKMGVVVLKSPSQPKRLRAEFSIHSLSPARRVRLMLDGREVAAQTYPGPGAYRLESAPVAPLGKAASVTLEADKTFSVPGDRRELSLIVTAIGFE